MRRTLGVVLLLLGCGGGAPPPAPPAKRPPAAAPAPAPMAPAGESTFFVSRVRLEDLTPGTGPEVEDGDEVTVDYELALTTGRVVESSPAGTPRRVRLGSGELLAGWEKAFAGEPRDKVGRMKRGGTRKALIPGEMGYGHPDWSGPVPDGLGRTETLILVFTVRADE